MLPAENTPTNAEATSRSNEATTSAAVSGVPSWNLTPWRILNVQVLPPLEAAQLSARIGTSFDLESANVSCSPGINAVTISACSARSGGSNEVAPFETAMRSVPPALPAATRRGAAMAPSASSPSIGMLMPTTDPRIISSRREMRPALNSSMM